MAKPPPRNRSNAMTHSGDGDSGSLVPVNGVEAPHHLSGAGSILRTRELYWHNVVREMLNGLSVMCQQQPEVFDGRFAVLTHAGERIAIGRIFPLFACSIPGSSWEREASTAVQCTVFRIITPDGEVFTLPISEVRGLHSLTPELVEQLQKLAEAQQSGDTGEDGERPEARPFGLAAFAALPKPAEDGGSESDDESPI